MTDGSLSVRQRRVAYCVGSAAFLFQFEAFLVHIALPDMQRELGVSASEIARVITIYLLGAVLALLPGGVLGRRFGFSRVFAVACAIATLGTVFSGCASSLSVLWSSRFGQGIGIGLMVSAGYTLIPLWLEDGQLGWGYGVVSQGAGLGVVLGLPAGGLAAHFLEWRWVFLAQAPLFVGLLVLAIRALPADQPQRTARASLKAVWARISSVGIFLYSFLVLFVFQLIVGGARYLAPFYLESMQGMTSLQSSLFMLVYALGFVASASVAGGAADRYGSGRLMLAAYMLASVGCLLFTALASKAPDGMILVVLLCVGVASGLFSAPNNRLVMSSVPKDLVQTIGPILPIALNLGVLSGISLFQYEFHALVDGARAPLYDQRRAYSVMYASSGLAFLAIALVHAFLSRRHKLPVAPSGLPRTSG